MNHADILEIILIYVNALIKKACIDYISGICQTFAINEIVGDYTNKHDLVVYCQ